MGRAASVVRTARLVWMARTPGRVLVVRAAGLGVAARTARLVLGVRTARLVLGVRTARQSGGHAARVSQSAVPAEQGEASRAPRATVGRTNPVPILKIFI